MVRRSFSVGVTIAALVLAISTVQDAQAQGKRGGGGMGMRGARGVNPLMLAGNPAVQKELGLSEENTAKVKEIAEDVRQEMGEQIANSGIDFAALRDLQ